jgi:hypothetical protein
MYDLTLKNTFTIVNGNIEFDLRSEIFAMDKMTFAFHGMIIVYNCKHYIETFAKEIGF